MHTRTHTHTYTHTGTHKIYFSISFYLFVSLLVRLFPIFSLSLSLSLALSISSLLFSRSHSCYSSGSIFYSNSSKNNIHLPNHAFIYLPIHLFVYLYVCLSIYLSIYIYVSTNLSPSYSFSLLHSTTHGALPLSPLPLSLPLDHSNSLSFIFLLSLLCSP